MPAKGVKWRPNCSPAQSRRPSGRAAAPAIALRAVERVFADRHGTPVHALQALSLNVERGELVAIVGPSGCGKTTLLELICGLQAPQAGTLESEPAALMPQRDLLLPWLSALDNAALALRIAHVPREQARRRAAAIFEQLGLSGFERAAPAQLSGGMRQRVAFVRTLLSGKPVLCLDEPLSALDAITRAELQEWLERALRASRERSCSSRTTSRRRSCSQTASSCSRRGRAESSPSSPSGLRDHALAPTRA